MMLKFFGASLIASLATLMIEAPGVQGVDLLE